MQFSFFFYALLCASAYLIVTVQGGVLNPFVGNFLVLGTFLDATRSLNKKRGQHVSRVGMKQIGKTIKNINYDCFSENDGGNDDCFFFAWHRYQYLREVRKERYQVPPVDYRATIEWQAYVETIRAYDPDFVGGAVKRTWIEDYFTGTIIQQADGSQRKLQLTSYKFVKDIQRGDIILVGDRTKFQHVYIRTDLFGPQFLAPVILSLLTNVDRLDLRTSLTSGRDGWTLTSNFEVYQTIIFYHKNPLYGKPPKKHEVYWNPLNETNLYLPLKLQLTPDAPYKHILPIYYSRSQHPAVQECNNYNGEEYGHPTVRNINSMCYLNTLKKIYKQQLIIDIGSQVDVTNQILNTLSWLSSDRKLSYKQACPLFAPNLFPMRPKLLEQDNESWKKHSFIQAVEACRQVGNDIFLDQQIDSQFVFPPNYVLFAHDVLYYEQIRAELKRIDTKRDVYFTNFVWTGRPKSFEDELQFDYSDNIVRTYATDLGVVKHRPDYEHPILVPADFQPFRIMHVEKIFITEGLEMWTGVLRNKQQNLSSFVPVGMQQSEEDISQQLAVPIPPAEAEEQLLPPMQVPLEQRKQKPDARDDDESVNPPKTTAVRQLENAPDAISQPVQKQVVIQEDSDDEIEHVPLIKKSADIAINIRQENIFRDITNEILAQKNGKPTLDQALREEQLLDLTPPSAVLHVAFNIPYAAIWTFIMENWQRLNLELFCIFYVSYHSNVLKAIPVFVTAVAYFLQKLADQKQKNIKQICTFILNLKFYVINIVGFGSLYLAYLKNHVQLASITSDVFSGLASVLWLINQQVWHRIVNKIFEQMDLQPEPIRDHKNDLIEFAPRQIRRVPIEFSRWHYTWYFSQYISKQRLMAPIYQFWVSPILDIMYKFPLTKWGPETLLAVKMQLMQQFPNCPRVQDEQSTLTNTLLYAYQVCQREALPLLHAHTTDNADARLKPLLARNHGDQAVRYSIIYTIGTLVALNIIYGMIVYERYVTPFVYSYFEGGALAALRQIQQIILLYLNRDNLVGMKQQVTQHAQSVTAQYSLRQHGHQVKNFKFYQDDIQVQWEDVPTHISKDICTCPSMASKMRQTGPNYTDQQGTNQMHVYTMCPYNLAAGLSRSATPDLLPSFKYMKEFQQFAQAEVDKLLDVFPVYGNSYTFQDYVRDAKPSKRGGIQAGKLFTDTYSRIINVMKIFVKPDEYNYRQESERRDGRPRLINGPHTSLQGYPGYLNQVLIRFLKEALPGFMVGYNCHQLADKLLENHNEQRVYLSNDGSSHDAHQNYHMIKHIDHYFLGQFLDLYHPYLDIPYQHIETVRKSLTDLNIPLEYVLSNGDRLFSGTLYGTVASGHPTLTTLGNTLRVMIMNQYWMHKAGLNENQYHVYVSGDDSLLYVDVDQVEDVRNTFGELWAPKGTTGRFGLGQASEGLITGIDFLSQWISPGPFKYYVTRLPHKAVRSGVYTDTQITDEQQIANRLANLHANIENPDIAAYLGLDTPLNENGDVQQDVFSNNQGWVDEPITRILLPKWDLPAFKASSIKFGFVWDLGKIIQQTVPK